MQPTTNTVQFLIHADGNVLFARFELAWDDTWHASAQSPKDMEGQTSVLIWVASRKHAADQPMWEIEYEISSACCDPRKPDDKACVIGVDSIEIMPPENAPHVEWQNPRSRGKTLSTAFVLLPRRAICGRFAVGAQAESQTLAEIAAGLPAISPTSLSRFGPADWPLPVYDQTAQNSKWLGKRMGLLAALNAGVSYQGEDWGDGIHDEALKCGWLRPYLEQNRSAYGGSGIDFFTGYQGLQHGRYALLALTLVAQRCQFSYTRPGWDSGMDGRPLSVDDFAGTSPEYDAVGTELPFFQNTRVIGKPDAAMLAATSAYLGPDLAHYVRRDRYAWECWEYFKTPLTERLIWASAEEARLVLSEKGPRPRPGFTPWNLRNLLAHATGQPHWGGGGRETGEACMSVAMMFKVRGLLISPGWKRWAQQMVTFCNTAAMPTGLLQRANDPPQWGPPEIDSSQAFEFPIQALGAYCLERQSGFANGDWLLRGATTLYHVLEQQPGTWDVHALGPFHFVYVAPHDGEPYADVSIGKGADDTRPPGDTTHKELMCGLAFRLSLDPAWLVTAASTESGNLQADPAQWADAELALLAQASETPAFGGVAFTVGEMQRARREGKL